MILSPEGRIKDACRFYQREFRKRPHVAALLIYAYIFGCISKLFRCFVSEQYGRKTRFWYLEWLGKVKYKVGKSSIENIF